MKYERYLAALTAEQFDRTAKIVGLTPAQAKWARRVLVDGTREEVVAEEEGVNRDLIYKIVRGVYDRATS